MSRSYPIVFPLEMRDCANSAMSFMDGIDEWNVIFDMTKNDLPVLVDQLNKIIESIETHGQS